MISCENTQGMGSDQTWEDMAAKLPHNDHRYVVFLRERTPGCIQPLFLHWCVQTFTLLFPLLPSLALSCSICRCDTHIGLPMAAAYVVRRCTASMLPSIGTLGPPVHLCWYALISHSTQDHPQVDYLCGGANLMV
jgi:hypothetical protein